MNGILEGLSLVFTDYTIRNVVLGALILGTLSGTLSAYAVLRKQSLLGDVMSHAALPGIILAFILTGLRAPLPLFIGAIIAGALGTVFMRLVTSQTRVKEDTAQGVVLAVFFGFGMTLLSWVLRQNNVEHAGLDKFLFGRAAAIISEDVFLIGVIGFIALLLILVFWKEFKLVSFDPGYGRTLGFPIGALDLLMTTLLVVAVVVGLQTVGVVLMAAMIVAPGTAARQWTNRLHVMVILSALFGAIAGVSGALISASASRLPTGPVIVLVASLIVGVSILFAPERGLVWAWVRDRRSGDKLRAVAVLEALYQMGQHHGNPLQPHALPSIQAVVSGQNARRTLHDLQNNELVVQEVGSDRWALTQKGVEFLMTMLNNLRLEKARPSALHEAEGVAA